LEDIERGYREASRGEEIDLGAKTASFKQWAEALKQYAQSSQVLEEIDYWLGEIGSEPSQLPVDYLNGANTRDLACNLVSSLSVDETEALLREVPGIYKTQINDVLLTSLLQAVSGWTGEDSLLVELEGHGREPVLRGFDLSRSVGWFTTRFPLRLRCTGESDLWKALDAVKEQLRRVPNNGIGYGLLCLLNDDEKVREKLLSLPKPQMSFNYLGQFGGADKEMALFTPASESAGRSRSPAGAMPHLIEVNAAIFGGQLRLDWVYSAGLFRRETIERVMQSFNISLRSIINERPALKQKSFTASNPPLTNLSPQQLESLINKITKR
ncbi:MAG: condensation domain-containing protein, partial [Blastocatellia bacterium]|nr:condensation domain-containing protein [Blastocatellia bacterium]